MNNFRCPKCNFLNFAEASSCKRCKTEFNQSASDYAANSTSGSNDSSPSNLVGETIQSQGELLAYNGQYPNQQEKQNFQAPQYVTASSSGSTSFPQNNLNSAEGKKTGMATASLVLGIVGLFTAGLLGVGAIIGIVLGSVALQRANKNPHEYGGKGLLIAGIALNCLSIISVFFIGIIAAIAIPNLLAARRAANESSAIASMRILMQAEADFMRASTVNKCGDLTDLLGARLIDTNLARGEKSGYKYVVTKNAGGSCELFASPLVSDGVTKTGTRSFYASTDEMEIRAASKNGAAASKNDPMLRMFNESSTKARQNRSSETDY